MPSVGKRDVDGNEVYLHDLLAYSNPVCEAVFQIVWSDELARFCHVMVGVENAISSNGILDIVKMKKIGNVFTNSEILVNNNENDK